MLRTKGGNEAHGGHTKKYNESTAKQQNNETENTDAGLVATTRAVAHTHTHTHTHTRDSNRTGTLRGKRRAQSHYVARV